MTRRGRLTFGLLARCIPTAISVALLASALCGCSRDQDEKRRAAWIHEQTAANNLYLLDFLNRPGEVEFYDGWYNVEHDPKTGGAWRWMERRGIVRLVTKPQGLKQAQDMELKIFGWVPHEHVGFRTLGMEFSVNGHVLGRFDPPKGPFEHTIFVPRWLLEHSARVDFVITVANTARPNGDWRDLGFASTGFHWKPVQAN